MEARSVPIENVCLGDVVTHYGLFGERWRAIVTGIEPHDDGSVTFYEVDWPLVSTSVVPARSLYEVIDHRDDDLERALRMFEER